MHKFLDYTVLFICGIMFALVSVLALSVHNQSETDRIACSVHMSNSKACAVTTLANNLFN